MKEKFGRKFIDKEKWPPKSPDLNPCDFFFCWVTSSRGCIPNTIKDLKASIEREVKAIPKDMLKKNIFKF